VISDRGPGWSFNIVIVDRPGRARINGVPRGITARPSPAPKEQAMSTVIARAAPPNPVGALFAIRPWADQWIDQWVDVNRHIELEVAQALHRQPRA